jgi:predicted nucleotidyltransferase
MGGKSRTGLSTGIARALSDVAGALDAHEHRAAVIGGIAVIARGVRRVTRDIDVAIAGADQPTASLANELQRHGIVPRIADAVAFAEQSQVLLMRHAATGVDIDVSRAWLPFEIEALAAASKELLAGVRIAVARPEDLIIFKAVAWRPQDQQDIERLFALYEPELDLERVRRHVGELSEALEIDRVRELDALIARLTQ